MTLNEYLKEQGYGSSKRLADAIGAHQPDVSDWANGNRPVPVSRCVAIELATDGAVTRKELRPNDWHQIWPEIADSHSRTSAA